MLLGIECGTLDGVSLREPLLPPALHQDLSKAENHARAYLSSASTPAGGDMALNPLSLPCPPATPGNCAYITHQALII